MVSRRRIDLLTARITEYRFWRHNRRARQLRELEAYVPIKWNITAKAMKARGIMDQISAEYDGFIEGGSEHLADVKGLRSQVGEMADDLQSAANVMGNSGGGSNGAGEAKEPAKLPPVTLQFETAMALQQPPAPPPAVIPTGQPGMRSRDVADHKASPMDFHG